MVFDNYIFMVMNTPFFQSFEQHFFCFVQKKRIKENWYHLFYNQTSFGNLGYDRSAVYLVVEEGETAKTKVTFYSKQVWPEKVPSLMKGHQLFA